jgi:hypothetical protein
MVGVSNGLVDQPTGATRRDFPLVMTMQDPIFKHPTAYSWSASFQRELPLDMALDLTYVGRMGTHLQRERNINQLQPGTRQANPGVNPDALRPYLGFGSIRLSENTGRSIYHGLQVGLERRFRGGLGFGVAYTLSRLRDNAHDKRNRMFNAFDPNMYWGLSENDRRHLFNVHYVYELPFWRNQDTLVKKVFGGWQISGVTYYQSGRPRPVWRGDDYAGVGDSEAQPWNVVKDPMTVDQQFSQGRTRDQNFWFDPTAFTRPAPGTWGDTGGFGRNPVTAPGFWSHDIALFKNIALGGSKRMQLRAEFFNFPNHPNLSDPNIDPQSADFGRVLAKNGERNIQLGVKFML